MTTLFSDPYFSSTSDEHTFPISIDLLPLWFQFEIQLCAGTGGSARPGAIPHPGESPVETALVMLLDPDCVQVRGEDSRQVCVRLLLREAAGGDLWGRVLLPGGRGAVP